MALSGSATCFDAPPSSIQPKNLLFELIPAELGLAFATAAVTASGHVRLIIFSLTRSCPCRAHQDESFIALRNSSTGGNFEIKTTE